MNKTPSHIKRRIKMQSKTVRIIGAMQPPEESLTDETSKS